MRRLAVTLVVLLAGCGDTAPPANDAAPQIKMANEHHDQLLTLTPDLQRLAMMRAIRQTRNACQRVDNAGYQQEYRNMRMWVAQCGPEIKQWAVFIAPNGDVQARDCAQAGELALPRCEPLPPAVPETESPFREGASDNAYRNAF